MSGDYQFDVFVSYAHRGSVLDWVRNHFYPALVDCLTDVMPHDPKIFVDFEQETGVDWPNNLRHGLLHSRYLLAILSPPYFRSAWCMAEWHTMRKREELLALRSLADPRGLIHAVSYADGEYFSDDAKAAQARKMDQWAIPAPVFRESREFVLFFQAMRTLATELSKQVQRVPAWQSTWPVVLHDPEPTPVGPQPRL